MMQLFEQIKAKSFLDISLRKNWWLEESVQSTFRDACNYFVDNGLNEPCEYKEDYGVVICGGGKYMRSTYCVIRGLRHFGCNLPITVFCYDSDEIDESNERILKNFDVKVVFVKQEKRLFRNLHSYAIKIYSICYSEYKNVLLIDADNLPSCNLVSIFETEQYDYDCLFFKDQIHNLNNREIRFNYINQENCNIFGVEYNSYASTDSGLIFINKEKYWKELLLTKWYNEFSEYYYRWNLGDKDLYWFAWKKLGTFYPFNASVPDYYKYYCLVHFDDFGNEISAHLAGTWNKIKKDSNVLNRIQFGDLYKNFVNEWENLKNKKFKFV